MIHKKLHVISILFLIILVAGCAASHLDEAKKQYEIALYSQNPFPYYNAALEELDAAIKQDQSQFQAYAVKGLIYRNLEDFERAIENLEIAKQGVYGGQQQWVPIVINLTYGDIFHRRAGDAIRARDWQRAQSYQETALEFFNNVIVNSFDNMEEDLSDESLDVTMEDLYIKAQERWAAGKFQMAVIAPKFATKEDQIALLQEAVNRLNAVIESYPDSAALRYYLADGYRKLSLVIGSSDATESERLKELALAQLRACAELGLPNDLRNPAAELVRRLSKEGTETETEMKILGTYTPQ